MLPSGATTTPSPAAASGTKPSGRALEMEPIHTPFSHPPGRVAGLESGMFARWLALFRATAEELFPPELAASFREKSERIAESPQLGIFYRPGQSGLNILPRSPR